MSNDSRAADLPPQNGTSRRARVPKAAAAVLVLALSLLAVAATVGRSWLETYGWGRTLLNETLGRAGLGSDTDFVVVSNAIDEGLYDKTWKLARWWPGRKSAKLHEESIASMRAQVEQHLRQAEDGRSQNQTAIWDYHSRHAKSLQAELEKLLHQEPATICRIQYEVLDNAGKAALRDQIFLIDNGTAWPLPPRHEERARQEFME